MTRSVVTFGECLARLSPPNHLRLRQATSLELFYVGSEANVASALASWGLPTQHVTRLPDNELGNSCIQALRRYGVGVDFIEFGGDRLGLYFLEPGTGLRPSRVIYDRAGSSFATLSPGLLNWKAAFAGARWFHWSGICPAVSGGAASVTSDAVRLAREAGLQVSCDLNYRHSLWQWGGSPSDIMPNLVAECDVLSANSAHMMLGLPDLPPGNTPDEALDVCSTLSSAFPNLKIVAKTCNEVISSTAKRYTAVMRHSKRTYVSRAFNVSAPVENVGAGDAFMAGLIYGLTIWPDDPQAIIDFAAASAVLKYTIRGDVNLSSLQDIERLLQSQVGLEIER